MEDTEIQELPSERVIKHLSLIANTSRYLNNPKAFVELPMPEGKFAIYRLVAWIREGNIDTGSYSYVFQGVY